MNSKINQTMNDGDTNIYNEILTLKQNQSNLAHSISLLYSEVLRTTSDPVVRRMCNRRIQELDLYVLTPIGSG